MTSISVSDYRRACSEYIHEALERPRMYYHTLAEFETTMFGHQSAFEQLDAIDRNQAFNLEFGMWLRQTRGLSVSAGWAYAIESLASAEVNDAEVLFIHLVEEFLSQWGDSMGTDKRGKP